MELILPEGKKEELKEKAQEGVGPETPKPFTSGIDSQGILTMRIDLKTAIVNQEHFYIFRGFWEHNLDQCIMYIMEHRQKIQEQQGKLIKSNQAGHFRNFINKVTKH